MTIRSRLLSGVAIAFLFAAPALAQQMPRNHPAAAPGQTLSKADQEFIKDAAIGGKAEVELGKLAQQNGQSQQVKDFGARMEKDHGAAGQQLASIASSKGVQLPDQLDAEHLRMRARLAPLHGEQFDREYMRMMVEDHDKDVKAFRKEARNSQDPDLKRFAQQTLQVIEQHDKMAHDITSSMTGVGSSRPPRNSMRTHQ